MIAVDLFSGCGGLTEGLKQAGYSVIAGAEIRAEAREAYELNHPEVKLFDDVRKLSLRSLAAEHPLKRGQLDLLAACPPCQGFSSLRTKNHLAPAKDQRNNLIFEVQRLVEELMPKALLVENVPGLLHNQRLAKFQAYIGKLGYKVAKGVLNASEFGVPQRRRRMIFLAVLGEQKPTIPAPLPEKAPSVRSAIGTLELPVEGCARSLHAMRQNLSPKVMAFISKVPKDGGSRSSLGKEAQLDCHKKSDGFKDVYGRLAWDKVCSTITRFAHNPSKGRYLHPEEDRGLSLYEALLLQGFPKNYKLPTDKGMVKTASLIGEAFPPPFARAQAEHIKGILQQMKPATAKAGSKCFKRIPD